MLSTDTIHKPLGGVDLDQLQTLNEQVVKRMRRNFADALTVCGLVSV